MEEVGPPPASPPPAAEAGPGPVAWIERGTTTALILLVTIPTDAVVMYNAMYQRVSPPMIGFIVMTWLISNLVMFLPWSGLWALATKVFRRRARFIGHLNTALLAGLLWTWLRGSLDVVVFAVSADDQRSVPYFLLLGAALSATLWGHLRLVSTASPRRLGGVAIIIGAFVVGIASGVRALAIRRTPAARTADITIFPHFLRLTAPVSIERHIQSLDGLKKTVDARAKEL